mmetsp:Transcript_167/g.382  ORF Transcript_167/g.382 Transcript_167/m.382 type:complete len:171 (+) Transcript_167:64-576(+)
MPCHSLHDLERRRRERLLPLLLQERLGLLRERRRGAKSRPSSPSRPTCMRPALSGFAAPHMRHCLFLANCKSLHFGQCQSPGSGCWLPGPATSLPAPSGRGAAQRRQALLRAKTWSPQRGQIQSPGIMALWGAGPPQQPPPLPVPAATAPGFCAVAANSGGSGGNGAWGK